MDIPTLTLVHQGNSSLAGQTHTFTQETVRIGRRPDNDVTYDVDKDRSVSGHHAQFVIEMKQLFVEDLGSANGTFLNGQQITGRVRVMPGQVVRFGDGGPEIAPALEGDVGPPDGYQPTLMDISTPTPQQEGSGNYVGAETLQMAIGTAAKRERKRMLEMMGLVVGCLVLIGGTTICLLGGGLGWLWTKTSDLENSVQNEIASQQEEVKKQLQSYEGELASVKGRVSSTHLQAGRLMQEIEARDKHLAELEKRTDLDKEARAKLESQLRGQLKGLQGKLSKQLKTLEENAGAGPWAKLVEKYERGIFLCIGRKGRGMSIGSAWVVNAKAGLLATNAHVVAIFDKFPTHAVIQNKTGKIFKVLKWKRHPKYKDGRVNCPDVGIVKIDVRGAQLPELPLAPAGELKNLGVGTALGTIGYPGEMMQEYMSLSKKSGTEITIPKAVATFKVGWIGRIMNYNKESDDWSNTHFIQHSASTTGGTSGSPMFNSKGNVVVLNNASFDIFIRGQPRRPHAANIKYGIRVDELRDLLNMSPDYQ